MEFDIQALLLNILILLFFLLFIPLILEQCNTSNKKKKFFMLISVNLAIISCISFPVIETGGKIFDLRYVATIIGGLYGGIPASISIWIVTVTYRIFFGGDGIILNVLIASMHFAFLIILFKKFTYSSKIKKLIIGTGYSIVTSMLTVAFIGWYINEAMLYLGFTYMISLSITVLLIIYITEIMNETSRLKIRTEKMDLVSQLASSISHEVRNPLTVVRGFLQLMSQVDLTKEKRDEYLKISIEEIDRANNIIKDYLSFAKPNSIKTELLDVNQELSRSLDVITPLANMNSVSIKTNINTSFIYGEKQLFQQCLLNIKKNCIEAMPNGGTLEIESKEFYDQVVISISDTGIGMTEEHLNRLGEPYFTTKGKKGTGLGMMSVFRIIESMNGTLHITSELQKGSKFSIQFPKIKNNESFEVAATSSDQS
ncbi:HAMP domain-containing sensor histidine kinase [Evansella sp. AB-P1]|uniref:sensor histidine kinase n=1 Tax=Evansella sp. AB-P1 TaxID=3037653 RepID=UPI00241C2253|nr:HAMP domain-containing sensor histidine kinase [Evansella sp. AB-P1]MDG5786209.1 HAMP domain-containing sensor histidine kinase [Evansella sp. AB-P1]